jgi:uncharacterized protein YebE (UPF0316 family)
LIQLPEAGEDTGCGETTMETLLTGFWGPLLIFFMRVVDVSLATVRMLLIMRNAKVWAPVIGFFEVLIWLLAAGTAIQHLDSPWHVLGYAGGFAAGNLVGLLLEQRLAFGFASIQVFARSHGPELADALRAFGHGVTQIPGRGRDGPVDLVVSVIRRKDLATVSALVNDLTPGSFVAVEEPTAIQRGWWFPKRRK